MRTTNFIEIKVDINIGMLELQSIIGGVLSLLTMCNAKYIRRFFYKFNSE